MVNGVFLPGSSDNPNALQNNFSGTQPFHFHNAPQGGPQFFVQQLFDINSSTGNIITASLENTEAGFSFTIDSPYTLRPPVNRPTLGVDFVISEILAGNSYLGIHTEALPIPATALAGDLVALADSSINGKIEWLYEGDDVASGGNKNDLYPWVRAMTLAQVVMVMTCWTAVQEMISF